MDFFANQDAARRKTKWLVAYFAAAVVSMIVVLYVVINIILAATAKRSETVDVWRPEVLLAVSAASLLIIGGGSLYKTVELRAGGEQVARMLGGRRISPNTTDQAERRLMNVVEEMALASGIAAPPVYVLEDEESINAFAAGFTPGDAVIGINRGTLNYLTRDELQGVVAHEFSHILNGDMRLNLRLIGILHGILLISLIGYYILRAGPRGGSRDRGKGSGHILLIGIAMWVIGLVGLLFARLIKAAISRQREYLADASAVQFTRYPPGISGALQKIGGLAAGSRIKHPEAETASHMFFGNALPSSMFGLLSTHPPLVDRIRRVDPQFDGKFQRPAVVDKQQPAAAEKKKKKKTSGLDSLMKPLEKMPFNPLLVLGAVGSPQPQHMLIAAQLLDDLPEKLRQAIHEPYSSRAVAFALLLDGDPAIRKRQLQIVHSTAGEAIAHYTEQLATLIQQAGIASRLPILELLQNSLATLSAPQYTEFRRTIEQLVAADQKITLFEFVMQRILLSHLDRRLLGQRAPSVKYPALRGIAPAAADLLAFVAHAGHRDAAAAAQAYAAGLQALGADTPIPLRERQECSVTLAGEALDKVAHSSPMVKKRVLAGLLAAAAADQQITVEEAEIVRAFAEAIDCPMPPMWTLSPGSEASDSASDE
jgi:Zn-dependent protease with chaperone function